MSADDKPVGMEALEWEVRRIAAEQLRQGAQLSDEHLDTFTLKTRVNEVRLYVEHRFDQLDIRLNLAELDRQKEAEQRSTEQTRTNRLLELLLAERKLPVPE